MFFVAVTDERVNARRPEPPSESGDVAGVEPLVAEDQHGMFGKSPSDPVESCVIEFRQVDAERLGAECPAQRTQFQCGHGSSSVVCRSQLTREFAAGLIAHTRSATEAAP